MKKLFILFILMCGGITGAMAQCALRVSLADRALINVALDGRYFNKTGQSVTVGDLPPGRHYLKIYENTQNRRGRLVQDVVYEGNVNTTNGAVTLFVLDANTGQTNVQDQDINTYQMPQQQQPAANNNNYQGNNSQYNNNQGNNQNNYQNTDQNNGNYNQNGGNDNNNNGAPVASPISADEVATLNDDKMAKVKTKVAAKVTDTQKMTALKEGLKGEKYTTDQVSDMMTWFIFESSKVEFAEWAYPNIVDKENFSNLDNKFSYKTSQDELDKFLQGQQR